MNRECWLWVHKISVLYYVALVGLISLKAGHYDDKGYLYILSKLLSNGVEMTRK